MGICATTPIEPMIAKGAETILSATQAIMYPPLAATLSTATVNLIPFCFKRANCEAAKP